LGIASFTPGLLRTSTVNIVFIYTEIRKYCSNGKIY